VPRVLIASDVPLTASGLESMLTAGHEVEVVVAACAQAEAVLRDSEIDVLVVDLDELGGENGRSGDLVHALAKLVPVLALTSVAAAPQLLRMGIHGVVAPTLAGEQLVAAVRALAAGLVVLGPKFLNTPDTEPVDDGHESEEFLEPLTAREQEVLALVAEGLLNKEIADRLGISDHTVKFHISSIMGKLGASSRTEAVARAARQGLVFF
jgi:DNA-binding NarL/FixJ family response regulator